MHLVDQFILISFPFLWLFLETVTQSKWPEWAVAAAKL